MAFLDIAFAMVWCRGKLLILEQLFHFSVLLQIETELPQIMTMLLQIKTLPPWDCTAANPESLW